MSDEPLRAVERLTSSHRIEGFRCGVEDLDRWLARSAVTASAAGTAATYVLCRGEVVVGVYALAMSSVDHATAPSRLRRGMPDPVPVVLLARLAIDRVEQGSHLGGHLLVDALGRSVRGGREFGARAVVVDAIDENAAGFYRHFGFHDLSGGRLWRRISAIADDLGAQGVRRGARGRSSRRGR